MGVAAGDIDADGDQDLFFTNVGDSFPGFVVNGDRRDDQPARNGWLLLRNEGGMRFTDVTREAGLAGYGFAWGAAFQDMNLDGRLDLLVSQNYVKWPVHGLFKFPGKLLLGGGTGAPPPAPNAAPSASFSVSTLTPVAGVSVTFTDTSTDADGTIAGRAWDLDGDGVYESSGASVSRAYPAAGTVVVGLRVTDDDGAAATTSRTLTVSAPPAPAPPPSTGTGDSAEIDFGPYVQEMTRRIKKAWFPPKGNESKRITVKFKIKRSGDVRSIRLIESSGLSIADNAAIAAVEQAAPFPPLPAGADDEISIKFTFDYNVFNGTSSGVRSF